MTVIRGYAETLLEATCRPRRCVERAALIVEAVDRLERMTGETLDFARGAEQAGAARGAAQPAGGRAGRRRRAGAARARRSSATSSCPAGGAAALDVDKLRRAVSNIAANARDAMGGRGRLAPARAHRDARRRGRPARAPRARDRGRGPGRAGGDPRQACSSPSSRTARRAARASGLAVARRFVEDHGGRLELLPERRAGAPRVRASGWRCRSCSANAGERPS